MFVWSSVQSVKIDCLYESGNWMFIGSVYTCIVKNKQIFSTGQRLIIDSALGVHENNKTDDDVTMILISYVTNLKFFPKNIDKVFRSLTAISIVNAHLEELTEEDLRPFPNLEFLHVSSNNLKRLVRDLFENNLQLKGIDLSGNQQLSHIAPHIFDKLEYLEALDVRGNNCKHVLWHWPHFRSGVLELGERINNGECSEDEEIIEDTEPIEEDSDIGMILFINFDLLCFSVLLSILI